jgi:hypothetical protein
VGDEFSQVRHRRACASRSRRSPRAFRCGTSAGATVRQAGARKITPASRRRRRRPRADAKCSSSPLEQCAFRSGWCLTTRAGTRTDSASSHRRAHRRLPLRCAGRVAARSPMSAALWATKAVECGREPSIHVHVSPPGVPHVVRWVVRRGLQVLQRRRASKRSIQWDRRRRSGISQDSRHAGTIRHAATIEMVPSALRR